MNKLKIAIVGCGSIGQRHAGHAQRMADLVAVCDCKEPAARAVAETHGCRSYLDLDAMLRSEPDVDLVSICTPNGLHAEHSIKALRARKHVLCEKPMALTVKECELMIHVAERENRRLFVVKQNRFNPPVAALKRVIDEGRLGRILNVQLNCFWNRGPEYYAGSDWKGTRALDGGILYTQYSHFIDLLYWMVGDVTEARALSGNLAHQDCIEFEDATVVALAFDNGALGTAHFTINCYAKNMEGSITIFGEKGTVKVGGQYLNTLEYQAIAGYTIPELEASRPPNSYGQYVGSMSNHDKVYENVIDVLTCGGSIMTTAQEGLKTVQIIEKIYGAVRGS